MPLTKRFQKMDPGLGVMVVGAKVTRHGARVTGTKTLTRGADVLEFVKSRYLLKFRHMQIG
jgi:hypothetical protein